jgi:hypothetical protein
MADLWLPLGAQRKDRPAQGDLLAHLHAVWRVVQVVDLPLSDTDRETWIESGMPDLGNWRGRPYRIECDHLAGARPDWAPADAPVPPARLDVPAQQYGGRSWPVYPSTRHPADGRCVPAAANPCRAAPTLRTARSPKA